MCTPIHACMYTHSNDFSKDFWTSSTPITHIGQVTHLRSRESGVSFTPGEWEAAGRLVLLLIFWHALNIRFPSHFPSLCVITHTDIQHALFGTQPLSGSNLSRNVHTHWARFPQRGLSGLGLPYFFIKLPHNALLHTHKFMDTKREP